MRSLLLSIAVVAVGLITVLAVPLFLWESFGPDKLPQLSNSGLAAKAVSAMQCQVKFTENLKGNTEEVGEVQIQARNLRGAENLPWIRYSRHGSPTVEAIHWSSWARELPRTMEWLGYSPPRVFMGSATVKSTAKTYELQLIGAERIVGSERKVVLLSTTNTQYEKDNALLAHQQVTVDQPSSCIR